MARRPTGPDGATAELPAGLVLALADAFRRGVRLTDDVQGLG